jgi:putative hemolysin
MDEESLIQLIVLIVLLLFSAFFSGSETAIFTLTPLEKEKLRRRKGCGMHSFLDLLKTRPDDILITVLIGNMVVNMFASALFDIVFFSHDKKAGSTILSIGIITIVLLIVGEMTPKNLAVRGPLGFTRFSAAPLYIIHKAVTPLRVVLNLIRRVFITGPAASIPTGEMMSATIKIGLHEGIINQLEYSLFESYFDFNVITAGEVMIPRTDVKGVDTATEMRRLVRDIRLRKKRTHDSYLLVFKENIDQPEGYLELKDLLFYQFRHGRQENLSGVIKPLHSVPESKKLNTLMREMKSLNCGMSLVVDEYGGTAGIITFQHLAENFLSYFYTSEKEAIEEVGKNRYNVPGTLEVKTLNDALSLDIRSQSRTIAGLLIEHLGDIPQEGSTLRLGETTFTVLKRLKNRIQLIQVEVAE